MIKNPLVLKAMGITKFAKDDSEQKPDKKKQKNEANDQPKQHHPDAKPQGQNGPPQQGQGDPSQGGGQSAPPPQDPNAQAQAAPQQAAPQVDPSQAGAPPMPMGAGMQAPAMDPLQIFGEQLQIITRSVNALVDLYQSMTGGGAAQQGGPNMGAGGGQMPMAGVGTSGGADPSMSGGQGQNGVNPMKSASIGEEDLYDTYNRLASIHGADKALLALLGDDSPIYRG